MQYFVSSRLFGLTTLSLRHDWPWLTKWCHPRPSNIHGGKTGQWEMVSDKNRSPQLVMRYHDDQQEQFLSIRMLFVPNYRKVDGPFGCWIRDRNAKAFHTTVSPLHSLETHTERHRWASYDCCIYVASELHVDIVAPWYLEARVSNQIWSYSEVGYEYVCARERRSELKWLISWVINQLTESSSATIFITK